MFFSQIRLKCKKTKLQQAIQERLDQIEKLENEEQKRQLEGEVRGLQSRNTVVEQLMQTEDNLHFLQVCLRDSWRYFIFSLCLPH